MRQQKHQSISISFQTIDQKGFIRSRNVSCRYRFYQLGNHSLPETLTTANQGTHDGFLYNERKAMRGEKLVALVTLKSPNIMLMSSNSFIVLYKLFVFIYYRWRSYLDFSVKLHCCLSSFYQ
jgi:hypothetical protein